MSIRRDKTVIENNLLTIMEKLIVLMHLSLDCYMRMNKTSLRKLDLLKLDETAGEIKKFTEMMIQ